MKNHDPVDLAILAVNDTYPLLSSSPVAAVQNVLPKQELPLTTSQQPTSLSLFAKLHAWMQAKSPVYGRLTTLFSNHVMTPAVQSGNDAQTLFEEVFQAISQHVPAANSAYNSDSSNITPLLRFSRGNNKNIASMRIDTTPQPIPGNKNKPV